MVPSARIAGLFIKRTKQTVKWRLIQARVLLAHELKLWQVRGIFKRFRKMNERRKIAQNVRSDQESALQPISAGKFLPSN